MSAAGESRSIVRDESTAISREESTTVARDESTTVVCDESTTIVRYRRGDYRAKALNLWTMPAILAVLSAIGLTVALVADGVGNVVGWAALSVPVLVGGWYSLARPRDPSNVRPRP